MDKQHILMVGKRSFKGFSCWYDLEATQIICCESWLQISLNDLAAFDVILLEHGWFLGLSAKQHVDFLHAFAQQPILMIFDGEKNIDREALITIGIHAVWSVEELQYIDLMALIKCAKQRHQRLKNMDYRKSSFSFQADAALNYPTGVVKLLDKEWVGQTAMMLKKLRDKTQQLNHIAHHDSLTGLVTRDFFNQVVLSTISHAQRRETQFALMMLDLDYFKEVNDTFGHAVGDQLLQQVSACLRKALRDEDVVARLGGDEFGILLMEISRPAAAGLVARKILLALNDAPFYIGEYEINVSASIGISCYPSAGTNDIDLMKHADVALYRSKETGRNCYQYFTSEINASLQRQMDLEKGLSQAVQARQIQVRYMPLKGGMKELSDVSWASLYWSTSEYGVVSPREFNAIAKQTLLACQLEYFLLDEVVKFLHFDGNKKARVLMPMSYLMFSHHDIVRVMKAALIEHELSGTQFVFVISGESWLRDGVARGEVMSELRALGCQFCWLMEGILPKDLSQLVELPLAAIGFEFQAPNDLPPQKKSLDLLRAIAFTMEWAIYGFVTQEYEANMNELGSEVDVLVQCD